MIEEFKNEDVTDEDVTSAIRAGDQVWRALRKNLSLALATGAVIDILMEASCEMGLEKGAGAQKVFADSCAEAISAGFDFSKRRGGGTDD